MEVQSLALKPDPGNIQRVLASVMNRVVAISHFSLVGTYLCLDTLVNRRLGEADALRQRLAGRWTRLGRALAEPPLFGHGIQFALTP